MNIPDMQLLAAQVGREDAEASLEVVELFLDNAENTFRFLQAISPPYLHKCIENRLDEIKFIRPICEAVMDGT